jgi:hypothetical protein
MTRVALIALALCGAVDIVQGFAHLLASLTSVVAR